MLIRQVADGVMVITQPAHAAVSSQLARAWGNDAVGSVEPFDDVVLGALLHDIGWIDWEQAPTLNRETGLPHSFLQLGTRVHLGIWDTAARRALAFGRYPALLTSMHFTGLYERFHDYSRDTDDEARDARALVAREQAFQHAQLEALRSDPLMAAYATDTVIDRNHRLVALWDGMSLAICHGVADERTFQGVPATGGEIKVVMRPGDSGLIVDPWPFGTGAVTVHFEGRSLTGLFDNESAMREALAAARWTTVETELRPAR
jgi:hypothetical protein